MGAYGPFETRVEIVERATRFVDLMIRNNDPNVTAYRVFGERTLNDAYGNPASATSGGTSNVGGDTFATGTITSNGTAAPDTVTIGGVVFTSVNPGPANAALQQFDDEAASGSAIATAASLVATINQAVSQGLISAANGGVTVTAVSGGTATVTLTASVPGPAGELTLATSAPARVTLSGPTMLHSNISPFIPYVGRESAFRSPLLIRRRLGRLPSRSDIRRMSRVMYDPDDYASIPTMPGEGETLFARTQELAITAGGWREVLGPVNNGEPVLGPIVVLPPAVFFGSPNAVLTLGGNAPANTQAVLGDVPPLNEGGQDPCPMHIVLPRPSTVTITNTEAAGGTGLLYAFRYGVPMGEIPADSSIHIEGGVKEILLASTDNTGVAAVAPAFSITAVVNLGVEL